MVQVQPDSIPLHLGTPEEFAQVRSALYSARFDEPTFFETFKVEQMSDVGGVDLKTLDMSKVPEEFEMFVRIFFGQRSIPLADVERVLGSSTLHAMLSLGLLRQFGVDSVYAPVLLYPVDGFLIASDRHTNPDGSEFKAPPDIVFPAIYGGTLRFLRLLPGGPASDSLDLCAGSGVGAFVLSRFSERAVSSDVTERATHFAKFNCALNDLNNVEVVCGDLYESVAGRSFDRIVAHPPYVPSLDNTTIWRDGGTTGELLVRRIIQGLPQYLRKGGMACVVSLGLDTAEGQMEERARTWLGSSKDEFDIIFASTNERTPDEVLRDLRERDSSLNADRLGKLKQAFAEAGIVGMPYGPLVLRRHSSLDTHRAWSLRTTLSQATQGADFEQTFLRHPRFSDPTFISSLAQSRPSLAPRLQVTATHVVFEGSLVPAEFIFETDKPFEVRGRVDGWMVPLFVRFDGKLTPHEIYDNAKATGDLPEGFMLEDFVGLVSRMIERGFMSLPDETYA